MPLFRIVFFPAAIVLSVVIVSLSLDASRLNQLGSEQLGVHHTTELAWKSVLENLSFSLYSGATDIKSNVTALFAEGERRSALAWQFAAVLLAATVLLFGIAAYYRRRRTVAPDAIVADLIAVAIIFLGIGLVAPILTLKAYTFVPVIGEVILKYEVKSVLTTIGTLAKSNNYLIAFLVALFSVVTPLAKLIVAVAVLQRRWPGWHQRGLDFIKAIGKWSMADVFVVAVLVAYFAASSDEFSEAHVGIGLYFFAAYCVLSQLATQVLINTFESGDALAGRDAPANDNDR